jgi:hypothetical protein
VRALSYREAVTWAMAVTAIRTKGRAAQRLANGFMRRSSSGPTKFKTFFFWHRLFCDCARRIFSKAGASLILDVDETRRKAASRIDFQFGLVGGTGGTLSASGLSPEPVKGLSYVRFPPTSGLLVLVWSIGFMATT